jgi:hypothetical protein
MTKAWVILGEECEETQRSLASTRMWKGPYGLRKGYLYQGEKLSKRRFWMKPIREGTPFILGGLRCTKPKATVLVDKNEA